MNIVIQCAARKRIEAGHMRSGDGTRVMFVADPERAPARDGYRFARPDDACSGGKTWREALLAYNRDRAGNPWGLYAAYELYVNPTYERLVARFGVENIYVLSAGWGLISADFLTPNYDITFTLSADTYKRRGRADAYRDFCMLPNDTGEPVVFFGGKDYLPLFCRLTRSSRDKKTIFYNSERTPDVPGYSLRRFATRTRTNWHYECVNAFLSGSLES